MNPFIANAVAANEASPSGNQYQMIIMIVVFILIFYFMILRPQQKRAREHRKLMESISKGDEVLTTGGIVGRVTKVTEDGYVILALNETNEIIVKRDFVAAVLPKGTIKAL